MKSDSENKQEKNKNYLKQGVHPNSTKLDKILFSKIKKGVYDYTTRNSHDYNPVEFEYRASSIGYCPRKILLNKDSRKYLDALQLEILVPGEDKLDEDQIDEIQFGTHISGQVIHEAIQEALQNSKFNDLEGIEEEVSFISGDGTFSMVGHYDLLVRDRDDNLVVIDIKSTSTKREYLPNPMHLTQLMAYQGMLKGIRGALLYVNRNNWEMTYIPQEFNKKEFSHIVMKLSNLAYHEKKKKLPVIDESIFQTECKTDYFSCPYFAICFPNYFEDELEII